MKCFHCNSITYNVFAPFYFLFIDKANHAIYSLNYNNGSDIAAHSIQVKAPITLQENSLIACALRFIKFSLRKLRRASTLKNIIAKVALRLYFRKQLIAKVALGFINAQENFIAKLRCAFTFIKY